MTAAAALAQAGGSLTKARRIYMKARRWRDADWYAAWPSIAPEWEAAAASISLTPQKR